VKELVSGVTRWRRRLDYYISAVASRSADDLDPPMRTILRSGLYELVYQRLPAYALSEWVELTKEWVHPEAARLANRVFREAGRRMEEGKLPGPEVGGWMGWWCWVGERERERGWVVGGDGSERLHAACNTNS